MRVRSAIVYCVAMTHRWIGVAGLVCVVLLTGVAESDAADNAVAGRVVEFRFVPTARTQIAVWIERADGTFLRTVALTQAVAFRGIGNRPGASQMNSGFRWPYGRREGVLPIWAHRRASSSGALLFPRVIFQDRISEGDASRTSEDSTPDDYFCLSFNAATTKKDALDAVTCATRFNSDKGRFVTAEDVAAPNKYSEPAEIQGQGVMRALDMASLYPPRRDLGCTTAGRCTSPDTEDVQRYRDEALRVMPELDAITMATPPAQVPQSVLFSVPSDWLAGDYVAWVEANVEGDYFGAYTDSTLPTPTSPEGKWDSWAITSGYPYRGQPSVVYRLPFTLGASTTYKTAASYGYGDVDGFGDHGGDVHLMDKMIVDDPSHAKGSGADRLMLLSPLDYRLQVNVRDVDVCQGNTIPGTPAAMVANPVEDEKHSHQWGTLRFTVPQSIGGIDHYEVRYSHTAIVETAPETFTSATPAVEAKNEETGLMVPTTAAPGSVVETSFGGMTPSTAYWIAVRAVDRCNVAGPFSVATLTTTPIHFTKLSGCFIATAAYGSPLAAEIESLRKVRDALRPRSAVFAIGADVYYQAGPAGADLLAKSDVARAVVRRLLDPVVSVGQSVLPFLSSADPHTTAK